MDTLPGSAPRILILETDGKTRSTLLRYAVKGWQGASVQSMSSRLEDILVESERLKSFDVLLAGCDFSEDGSSNNSTLRALRAISADPVNPAVVLLTNKGSEYTAVQAIKAGAFDYIPKTLMGREQILSAVQRALLQRNGPLGGAAAAPSALRLFGYDMRRCLAQRENVSVHVAFSAERRKEAVLKVLHRGRGRLARDENFEQLVDEFKLLYDIDDPAVAEIYDFRVTREYCYIAMEYFPLGHLGTRLGKHLPPVEALRFTAEIAHALSIVHGAGIVHRDLKPANVMLRDNGTTALIDFGISSSAFVNAAARGDGTEAITGTPYYMSPEQARGEPTGEPTDVYALGVILYQMLTGEKLYVGETPRAILRQHCDSPLPQLPAALGFCQPLLDRLLAKDPAQRPGNARELIEVIEAAEEAAAAHEPPHASTA